MATLQQQVQQHLADTGISLRELAKQAAIGKSTVALVASGRSNPSIRTRRKLQAAIRDYKPQTLDATVEQLAAQCVNADLTHVRDDALECGKQRRIAALEAEVSVVREQRNKLGFACEELTADLETEKRNFAALEQVHEQREQHLKSCENALIEAHVRDTDMECAKYRRVMALEAELDAWQLKCGKERDKAEKLQWSLNKSEAFALVVTKDLQIMQASWKAACVQAEQLQKQLDHGQAQFASLQAAYDQRVDDEREMLAQIDTLLADRANMRTEYSLMRLRVYAWSLIAALALVVVSSLVVWGGV